MERSKYIILILLAVLISGKLEASYKSRIYEAYISNNMEGWKKIIDQMNAQSPKSDAFILELVNYQYGYIGYCVGIDMDDDAEKYLELAEKNVAYLESKKYKLSKLNAYKSAFYGYEIGLNAFKAPYLGSKSMDCAELSIEQDEKNPDGYIQIGNIYYYMPAIFGGSRTEALNYYLKALKLIESSEEELTNNWNYLNLLNIIAVAYFELEKYKTSKYYCDKVLKIEPNFLWVKIDLYPVVLKKLQESS